MLTIKTNGVSPAQLAAQLQKSIDAIDGRKTPELYQAISQVIDRSTTVNFQSGGRPTWPARKYTYRWPILRKTLIMMRKTLAYIRNAWKTQGNRHIKEIKSTDYGLYHQYGKGQETRPFVKLSAQEQAEIKNLLWKALKHG